MAISDTIKYKFDTFVKSANGYIKMFLSSDDVMMKDNQTTLQGKVDSIDSSIGNLNSRINTIDSYTDPNNYVWIDMKEATVAKNGSKYVLVDKISNAPSNQFATVSSGSSRIYLKRGRYLIIFRLRIPTDNHSAYVSIYRKSGNETTSTLYRTIAHHNVPGAMSLVSMVSIYDDNSYINMYVENKKSTSSLTIDSSSSLCIIPI